MHALHTHTSHAHRADTGEKHSRERSARHTQAVSKALPSRTHPHPADTLTHTRTRAAPAPPLANRSWRTARRHGDTSAAATAVPPSCRHLPTASPLRCATHGQTDTAPPPTRNFSRSHAPLSHGCKHPRIVGRAWDGGKQTLLQPTHQSAPKRGKKNHPRAPPRTRSHAGARLRVAQQVAAPAPAGPSDTGSETNRPALSPRCRCPCRRRRPPTTTATAPVVRGAPGPAAVLTWMRPVLRSVPAPGALIQRRLHRLLPAGTGLPPPPRLLRFVIHG